MKKLLVPFLGFFLALLFLLPEVSFWSQVHPGSFPLFPIRNYEGDPAHYNAIAWSAIVDGQPNSNAYFSESTDTHSQFFIAQSLFAFLGPLVREVSFVWIDLAVRLVVGLSSFLLLGLLLCAFGVERERAFLIAFSLVAVFGPVSFRGYALAYWFFPALLASIYCTKRFVDSHSVTPRAVAFSLAAIILGAVHPVYFSMIGFANLLGWIVILRSAPRSSNTYALFGVWALSGFALFWALFAHFLFASVSGNDAVMRIVGVVTRLPIHPFYSMGLCLIALMSWRFSETRVLSYYAIGALVGLNSYILTGTYIANDHYATPLEDFAVFFLFIALALGNATFSERRRVYGIGALALFLANFYEHFRYLEFRPGYMGRYVPVLLGYFGLAFVLLLPHGREYVRRFSAPAFLIVCAVFAFMYGFVLMGKENTALHAIALRDEKYESLLIRLNELPRGVVLADTTVSNLVSLYSHDKTYWHAIAFSETATNAELKSRWRDAYLFLAADPAISGLDAGYRVLGNANRCGVHRRDEYYAILARWGFPQWQEELCDTYVAFQKQWPGILAEARMYQQSVAGGSLWKPIYRLDYLVVDQEVETIDRALVERFFTLSEVVSGRFAIYTPKR